MLLRHPHTQDEQRQAENPHIQDEESHLSLELQSQIPNSNTSSNCSKPFSDKYHRCYNYANSVPNQCGTSDLHGRTFLSIISDWLGHVSCRKRR